MRFIIFDLEATCDENTSNFDNEIIEIGAVQFEDKIRVGSFQSYVHPKVNPILTPFCIPADIPTINSKIAVYKDGELLIAGNVKDICFKLDIITKENTQKYVLVDHIYTWIIYIMPEDNNE